MHGESHVLQSDLMYVLCHNASARRFDLTIGGSGNLYEIARSNEDLLRTARLMTVSHRIPLLKRVREKRDFFFFLPAVNASNYIKTGCETTRRSVIVLQPWMEVVSIGKKPRRSPPGR